MCRAFSFFRVGRELTRGANHVELVDEVGRANRPDPGRTLAPYEVRIGGRGRGGRGSSRRVAESRTAEQARFPDRAGREHAALNTSTSRLTIPSRLTQPTHGGSRCSRLVITSSG